MSFFYGGGLLVGDRVEMRFGLAGSAAVFVHGTVMAPIDPTQDRWCITVRWDDGGLRQHDLRDLQRPSFSLLEQIAMAAK